MRIIRRKVIKGEKRGRVLGFPTVNLKYYKRNRIKFGVWAVEVKFCKKLFNGVAHIGPVPTFNLKSPRIEIFLFNFSKNLYNKKIRVKFIRYLRSVKRFKDEKSLVAQIKKDCQLAKRIKNQELRIKVFQSAESGLTHNS